LTFHYFAVDLIFVVVEIASRFPIGRVFSVTKRLFIACGFLAALPFAASASRLISCSSCDPTPVVLFNLNGTGALDVLLTSSPDQAFSYENDTGAVINSLEFDALIATGLGDTTIVNGAVTSGAPAGSNTIYQNFTCDQIAGFFQNCTITYNSTTGDLSYLFAGIGPPSPPNANINFGDWQGEKAGIPACPAQYASTPTQCYDPSGLDYDRGLFTLDFQNFNTNPDYTNPNSPPTFTGSYTVATPEPSFVLLLVSGLFLLWFVRRRKVAQ
jgi:hypothetical protein